MSEGKKGRKTEKDNKLTHKDDKENNKNKPKEGVKGKKDGDKKKHEGMSKEDEPKSNVRKNNNRKNERKTIAGLEPLKANNEEEFKKFEENYKKGKKDKKAEKKNDIEKKKNEKDTPVPDKDENLSKAAVDAVIADLNSDAVSEQLLDDLAEALKKDESFRHGFLKESGFDKLALLLVKAKLSMSVQILSIFMSVMEDPVVITTLFGDSAVILTTLIWLLVKSRTDVPIATKVYSILAKLPIAAKAANFEDSQKMLLNALELYNYKINEGRRFLHLIQGLQQAASNDLKIAILQLINTLIGMHDDLDSRLGMRTEFISLGLSDILKNLEERVSNEDIKKEIRHYRDQQLEDERELHNENQSVLEASWRKDEDIKSMVEAFMSRLHSQKLKSIAIEIFTHLLRIRTDDNYGASKLLLVSRLISQIASDSEHLILEGKDPYSISDLLQSIQNSDKHKSELDIAEKRLQDANLEIIALKDELSKKDNSDEIKKLHSEVEKLGKQVGELSDLKAKLQKADIDLSMAQQKLTSSNQRLSYAEKTLRETDLRLSKTERSLQETEAELKALKSTQHHQVIEESLPLIVAKPTEDIHLESSNVEHDDPMLLRERERILKAISKFSGSQPSKTDNPQATQNKSNEENDKISGKLSAIAGVTVTAPIPQTKAEIYNNEISSSSSSSDASITVSLNENEKLLESAPPLDSISPRSVQTFIKLPTKKRKGKGALQEKLAAMHARSEEEKKAPIDVNVERTEQEKFNLASQLIKEGNVEGFSLLLGYINDIDMKGEQDEDQNTLLHWAVACEQLVIAKLLLEKGAQQLKNAYDETPLELAKSGLDDGQSAYKVFIDLLSPY